MMAGSGNNQPMRLLIVTNMYPVPEAPWYGVFVQEQEHALRAMGVEVEVSVHLGSRSRWNYPRAVLDIAALLRRGRYDLIHSHHTYSTIVTWAAKLLSGDRTPLIQTIHDSEIFRRDTQFNQDWIRRLKYSKRIKAFALRRCQYLIPVHPAMVDVILQGSSGARPPTRVIPAGIDLARFDPAQAAAARQRLGWRSDRKYIFFPPGPAKPEKRFDLARAAFERVARDRPGLELVVGGAIPYERMPDHMLACDVMLLTSDYEASPTVVKEALACERPIVSTDNGDVRLAYGDLPGVFVRDWDADSLAEGLARALAAPTPYGGRDRLRHLELDRDQVARRLLAVYREILGSRT